MQRDTGSREVRCASQRGAQPQGLAAGDAHPSIPPTTYHVDAHGIITAVGGGWSGFAAANEAAHLTPELVIGRRHLDFVAGPTMPYLYGLLHQRVAGGAEVVVASRCDSPTKLRWMDLKLTPDGQGGVTYEAKLTRIEPRPASHAGEEQEQGDRGTGRVVMCGWCKRVKVNGEWLPLEEAVMCQGLFATSALPWVTHGVCSTCYEQNLLPELFGEPHR